MTEIVIKGGGHLTPEEVASELRKASNQLSPVKKDPVGSRIFPTKAGQQIYDHFDGKFRDTLNDIKKEIDRILG